MMWPAEAVYVDGRGRGNMFCPCKAVQYAILVKNKDASVLTCCKSQRGQVSRMLADLPSELLISMLGKILIT